MALDVLKDLNLKSKKEDQPVTGGDLFVEGNVVGLYFSAHWCPPCRAFTPQLAEWYKKFKAGPNGPKLEIVFVSSDRDKNTFDEYYAEMPWLALPYENRDAKSTLSTKFKVAGIPTLVLLNGLDGEVLNKDGRTVVMEDPEGAEFPWKPKPFLEIIPGNLVNKEGSDDLAWSSVTEDYIGLYFSAHWCGPCRTFTPSLVKTYSAVRDAGKSFQIIFVSSDRDEDSMKEYMAEMPWLAIPFGDKRKKELSQMFEVSGIPTLVILSKDGEVITQNGRAALSQDPEGKDFPWIPKPVNPLNGPNASNINDEASIIWFLKSDAEKEKAVEILTSLSLQHKKEVKGGKADPLLFFYHTEDDDDEDIGKSLMSFCHVDTKSELVLIDIPNQKTYVLPIGEDVNAESVGKVVADHRSKTLAMEPIRS